MRTTSSPDEGPNVGRAALWFGAALVASLGIGVLIHSDTADPDSRPVASSTRTARPAADRSPERPDAQAAVRAAEVRPAVATAVEFTAAPPAEEEALPPVTYADAAAAFRDRSPEAADLFRRYADEHPDNAWAHYMLGLSLRREHDPAGAEVAFMKSLELDPDHGKSLVNLSRALLDLDRAEEALPFAEKAAALATDEPAPHRVLGRVLHTLGRTDAALGAYADALAVDPDDAWSLNNSALIYIEQEEFAAAADRLRLAVDADSSIATFRNNLGVALERSGRYREAELAYSGALGLDDGYDKARVSLARVTELVETGTPAGPAPLLVAETEAGGGEPAEAELAAAADPTEEFPASTDEIRP